MLRPGFARCSSCIHRTLFVAGVLAVIATPGIESDASPRSHWNGGRRRGHEGERRSTGLQHRLGACTLQTAFHQRQRDVHVPRSPGRPKRRFACVTSATRRWTSPSTCAPGGVDTFASCCRTSSCSSRRCKCAPTPSVSSPECRPNARRLGVHDGVRSAAVERRSVSSAHRPLSIPHAHGTTARAHAGERRSPNRQHRHAGHRQPAAVDLSTGRRAHAVRRKRATTAAR